MFKFLLFIFILGAAWGIYTFSSDSAKDNLTKASTTIVKDAASNAADAAIDKAKEKASEASHKVVARAKDVKKASAEKMKK